MKKLILLSILLIVGCAGIATMNQPIPNEEQTLKIIKENLNSNKSTIYNGTIEWMAKHYVDSKAVIEVKDSENGLIVGKGITLIDGGLGVQFKVRYTLTINVKDNRLRASFDSFTFFGGESGNPYPMVTMQWYDYLIQAKDDCVKSIDDLESFIKKSKSDSDW